MKKCPVCNRTYDDASLNFCQEDGATLVQNGSTSQSFGQTAPNSMPFGNVPPTFHAPKKKSNALAWTVGVIGAIVILGVVGLIGLLAIIGIYADNSNTKNGNNRANVKFNSNASIAANTKPPANTKTTGGKPYTVNFARWGEFNRPDGQAKIVGGEYQVAAGKNNFFYVVIASAKFDDEYLTNDATVRVRVRSVTGTSPSLGYGLVMNSDVDPMARDYAFLIRTDSNPSYRVVQHTNDEEKVITNWTPFAAIRGGTQTNQLEVRSSGKTLSFYINGQAATSVSDTSGESKGIVGVYTSDMQAVGFSDLEIEK